MNNKNYFACFGHGKTEEEDARLIFTLQTRRIQTFNVLFPQNNPPPPCACYRVTIEKQFQKIDKISKEHLYVTSSHSFIFNSSRGLINLNFNFIYSFDDLYPILLDFLF